MNHSRFFSQLILSALLTMTLAAVNLQAQTTGCSDCAEFGRIAVELQRQADYASYFAANIPEAEEQIRQFQKELDNAIAFKGKASDHELAYIQLAAHAEDQQTRDKYNRDRADANNEYQKQLKREHDLEDQIDALKKRIKTAKADAQKLSQDAQKAWNAYYDCIKKSKCPPADRTATGVTPYAVRLPSGGAGSWKVTISNSCPKAEQYGFSSSDLAAGLFEPPDPVTIDTGASREIALTFNAKASGPGLFFGNITIKCLTCDQSCPRPEKSLPVVVYAPAQ
jgi:hypothetical protein